MEPKVSMIIFAAIASLAAFPALADGDVARGTSLFKRCSACHTATDQNRVGPGLLGVVGRKAGTEAGYKYSGGMAKSDVVWDDATLDAFLAAPRKVVQGTSMSVSIANATDRQDIIAYLHTLAKQ